MLIAAPEDGHYSKVEFSYYNDPRFSKDLHVAVAFVQANAKTQASAFVHKWVDKLHRPDQYGPPYPDITAAVAVAIDRGDFIEAWVEARKRVKKERIRVVTGRGIPGLQEDDPPTFFAIYDPPESTPHQPKS